MDVVLGLEKCEKRIRSRTNKSSRMSLSLLNWHVFLVWWKRENFTLYHFCHPLDSVWWSTDRLTETDRICGQISPNGIVWMRSGGVVALLYSSSIINWWKNITDLLQNHHQIRRRLWQFRSLMVICFRIAVIILFYGQSQVEAGEWVKRDWVEE